MSDTETISEVVTRFANIVNSLKAFGRDIPNVELAKKIYSKKLGVEGDYHLGSKRYNYIKIRATHQIIDYS